MKKVTDGYENWLNELKASLNMGVPLFHQSCFLVAQSNEAGTRPEPSQELVVAERLSPGHWSEPLSQPVSGLKS
jgi:hypothetical protein